MVTAESYTNGEYSDIHPDWHIADSPWKAGHVVRMLARHNLRPRTVTEIGCGAGAVLAELQPSMPPGCLLHGFDVSPQALLLSRHLGNDHLHYTLGGASEAAAISSDVVLLMDVVEHIEDVYGFLRAVRFAGTAKIFHIPLDLSVQGLVRNLPGRLRHTAGHMHFFTKVMFLQTLEQCGYHVVDYFYTLPSVEGSWSSPLSRLASIPRRVMFSLSPEATALVPGGCSLLVYAE